MYSHSSSQDLNEGRNHQNVLEVRLWHACSEKNRALPRRSSAIHRVTLTASTTLRGLIKHCLLIGCFLHDGPRGSLTALAPPASVRCQSAPRGSRLTAARHAPTDTSSTMRRGLGSLETHTNAHTHSDIDTHSGLILFISGPSIVFRNRQATQTKTKSCSHCYLF